jgi:hypothetical protein
LPQELLRSTIIYPAGLGAAAAPAETIVNKMGMYMKLGSCEERSIDNAKGEWPYRAPNNTGAEMVQPTDLWDLTQHRTPIETILNQVYH